MLASLVLAALSSGVVCVAPTVAVPAHEPRVTRGPTELVAGLYIQGGAFIPGCPQQPRGPYAGTLTATNVRTGRVAARVTRRRPGRLFVVPLAPGTYSVSATTSGGLRTVPARVTIRSHRTVRQDVFADVP